LGGVALTIAGLWYYRRDGRVFAQMLTACGIVVLYLATYSAFGFYDLLPSFHAGGFLTAVVLLSVIIAVCYDSPSIALVAVLGGLVCPLLMRTEQDSYVALFCYLVSINLGVAVIALVRSWPFVSSVALYGTQGLFWSWYWGNYHPEKLGWSLAFQGVIFGLYVGQDLAVQLLRGTGARRETAFRILVNAACGFGAYYVLMRYDHRPWMGVSAVVMAAFYALMARGTLVMRRECTMELVTTISVAAGFLTLAIPLEADAHWLAVAWAATAVTIGWFSMRVELPALRLVAALIATLAVGRVVFVDLWSYPDDTWWLFFNPVAIPSVGVAAAMIAGVLISRRYWTRLGALPRVFASAAGLSGIVLLWLVLTVDIYNYFDMLATLDVSDDPSRLLWLGELCVSVLWTLYASMLLAIGFRFGQRLLRWVAIGFFMLTIGKVFLVDTSELSELYRIVAFFILAFFLATAAVVYQRVRPGRPAGELEDSNGHAAC
jgi:uncharacterized membrane protein